MTLGKKIKHFRNAINITQQKLSSLTKIHNVTIKKYESEIVYRIEEQELKLEKLEMKLISLSTPLSRIKN